MRYWCLSPTCNHEWTSRGSTPSRQCPSCWRRSIVDEDELRLAGLVAEPLSQVLRGTPPPLPTPEVVLKFPFALNSFVAVVSRASNQHERRRAVELMLVQVGVALAEAVAHAARMYP